MFDCSDVDSFLGGGGCCHCHDAGLRVVAHDKDVYAEKIKRLLAKLKKVTYSIHSARYTGHTAYQAVVKWLVGGAYCTQG